MLRAKNRWQAFGIHLFVSAVIFVVLLSIIVTVWYPGIFINLGGYQGIKIMAGVDMVLGPVLTLLIYNPAKRKTLILLDLSIITLIQVGALLAGGWLVYQERPIVQVLSDDGLYVHTLSEFRQTNTEYNAIKNIAPPYPKVVYLDLPEKPEDRAQVKLLSEFSDGKVITLRTDLYLTTTAVDKERIDTRLSQFEFDSKKRCYWMNIISYHSEGMACVSIDSGAISFRKTDDTTPAE